MVWRPSSFWSWGVCELTLKPRRSLRSFRPCVAHELMLSVLAVSEAVPGAVELPSFCFYSAARSQMF